MYLALEKIVKERYHQNQLKQKVQSPADLEIPPQHPLLESQCRHTGRLLSCTSSIGAVFYLIHIGCSFLFFFLLFFFARVQPKASRSPILNFGSRTEMPLPGIPTVHAAKAAGAIIDRRGESGVGRGVLASCP